MTSKKCGDNELRVRTFKLRQLSSPSRDDADTATSHSKLRSKIVFIVNSMMITMKVGLVIVGGDISKMWFILQLCSCVKITISHVCILNRVLLFYDFVCFCFMNFTRSNNRQLKSRFECNTSTDVFCNLIILIASILL